MKSRNLKYVQWFLVIVFILALIGEYSPAMADDGANTQHVTYKNGDTPVFDNQGVEKTDTQVNQPFTQTNTGNEEVTPTALGWNIIYKQNWDAAFLPGSSGWTVADLKSDLLDITWGDVATASGGQAVSGNFSIWPAIGGADGDTPTNFSTNYPNNIETSATYGPFSLAGYSDAKLDFMLSSELEYGFDYFCFSASADGVNFEGECTSATTSGFEPVSLPLTKYKGKPSVWIQFYFVSDGSTTRDGPFVDEIFISGKQSFTFNSNASQDGWVLESKETSEKGGILNTTDTILRVGDEKGDKEYRSIFSFNTKSIPDTAVITNAYLKYRVAGTVGNTANLDYLVMDSKAKFGSLPSLQISDFQAIPNTTNLGYPPISLGKGWRLINIVNQASNINKTGTTQFRMNFSAQDNDDNGADYLKIYSGNAGAANAPKLVIDYYMP